MRKITLYGIAALAVLIVTLAFSLSEKSFFDNGLTTDRTQKKEEDIDLEGYFNDDIENLNLVSGNGEFSLKSIEEKIRKMKPKMSSEKVSQLAERVKFRHENPFFAIETLQTTPIVVKEENLAHFYDENAGRFLKMVPGEVIVKLQHNATEGDLEQLAENLGIEIIKRKSEDYAVLKTDPGKALQLIESLESSEIVAYSEPNYAVKISEIQFDDMYFGVQKSIQELHIDQAWTITKGDKAIKVAVIDSGAELLHEDLVGVFDDGFDFVNDDDEPDDENGHGTFITGIIAAHANNGKGIAGIAAETTVVPIKVIDKDGNGSIAALADGIRYAADVDARIINISAGTYGYSSYLEEAVLYAQQKGSLIIASVGNDGVEMPFYPAAFSGVIGVGASNSFGKKTDFSNTGTQVDLLAPGLEIYSTKLGNTYGGNQGTSVSAAIVSGIAALVASSGNYGSSEIAKRLIGSATAAGFVELSHEYGHGIPSAIKAIDPETNDINVISVDVAPVRIEEQDTIQIRAAVQNKSSLKDIHVSVFLNGEKVSEEFLKNVKENEIVSLEAEAQAKVIGDQRAVVRAEAGENIFSEKQTTFYVEPVIPGFRDVALENVSLRSNGIFPDGIVQAQVTVTNKSKDDVAAEIFCAADVEKKALGDYREQISLRAGEERTIAFDINGSFTRTGKVSILCKNMSPDDNFTNDTKVMSFALDGFGEIQPMYEAVGHHPAIKKGIDYLKYTTRSKGDEFRGILEQIERYGKTAQKDWAPVILAEASNYEDNKADKDITSYPNDVYWKDQKWMTDVGYILPVAIVAYIYRDCDENGWSCIITAPVDIIEAALDWAGSALEDICSFFGFCDDEDDIQVKVIYEQTLDHFWLADKDTNGTQKIESSGWDPGSNVHGSAEKGRIHWRNALYWYGQFKKTGNSAYRDQAYTYLGRVIHLLQDNTVPAHIHVDLHPSGDAYDKDYMTSSRSNNDYNVDYNTGTVSWNCSDASYMYNDLRCRKMEHSPFQWRNQKLANEEALHYLFFSSNQTADFFPSTDYKGNTNIPSRFSFLNNSIYNTAKMRKWYGNGNYVSSPSWFDVHTRHIADDCYPYAIMATASLFKLFEKTAMGINSCDFSYDETIANGKMNSEACEINNNAGSYSN